jgi:hypothetical protein
LPGFFLPGGFVVAVLGIGGREELAKSLMGFALYHWLDFRRYSD